MNRRDFLRRVGAGGAALALAPSLIQERTLAGKIILNPNPIQTKPEVGDFMSVDGKVVAWGGGEWVDVSEQPAPKSADFLYDGRRWTIYPGWLAWRGKVYCFECFAQTAAPEGGIQGWAVRPNHDPDLRCDTCGMKLREHRPYQAGMGYDYSTGFAKIERVDQYRRW